jgi:hypothetical protein
MKVEKCIALFGLRARSEFETERLANELMCRAAGEATTQYGVERMACQLFIGDEYGLTVGEFWRWGCETMDEYLESKMGNAYNIAQNWALI